LRIKTHGWYVLAFCCRSGVVTHRYGRNKHRQWSNALFPKVISDRERGSSRSCRLEPANLAQAHLLAMDAV
jgi:hypothetical protein